MPFLGLADIAGIQQFLFRIPKLKEIAAASARIESISSQTGAFRTTDASCMFAAGGNAALWADDRETLQQAFRIISRALLEDGDGLETVVCIEEYVAGTLPAAYRRALGSLERRKFRQPRNTNFTFSGLTPPVPHPSPKRIPFALSPYVPAHLMEPSQFDDLICGSREQTGLMAIVSVDGIGMGQRLNRWLIEWEERSNADCAFRTEFAVWSEGLKARWSRAWEGALQELAAAFREESGFIFNHVGLSERGLWLRSTHEGQPAFLPCRHIYQGGDDLSFACDARVALSLTESLLRLLRDLPTAPGIPSLFASIHASAGIVFVDSHFPFARAVDLADQVRQRAKKAAVEAVDQIGDGTDFPPPALAWWVNRQGSLGLPDPPFEGASLKPYLLDRTTLDHPISWVSMDRVLLPALWQTFGRARGKFKEVVGAAEYGDRGQTLQRVLQLRPVRGAGKSTGDAPFPQIAGFDPETGFKGEATYLLDAAELFDLHFPFGSYRSATATRAKS